MARTTAGARNTASARTSASTRTSSGGIDQTLGSTANDVWDTANIWHAQPFTPTKKYLSSVVLQLKKVGNPTGNITVQIQTTNGNVPSGTVLASATLNQATITTSYLPYTFNTKCTLTPGTKYHCCKKGPGTNTADNKVAWGYATGVGLAQWNWGPGNFTNNATTVQQSLVTNYGGRTTAT